ncbi:NAD dependent epimerase dehydratase (Partial), partial [Seminavis robusta]|eukprot:Sro2526_g330250.1 NAD dependent epimerase dehydratase (167) ;mRNA; r:2-502
MDSIARTVADYALITKHSKRSSNPNWHRNSSGTSSRTDASPELPFVVGAGLGRTGTHSLQAALATLGYRSRFHMSEIMGRYVSPEPWFELARTERDTGVKNKTLALQAAQSVIDQGYRATTDYPCCLLYPEFLELTDGKVILSVRSNASGWKKSILETLAVLPRPFF